MNCTKNWKVPVHSIIVLETEPIHKTSIYTSLAPGASEYPFGFGVSIANFDLG